MTREEAIEVVKERLDYYEREKRLKAACEVLIPELAESEDERIRKEIYNFFKNFKETGTWKSISDVNTWLAYLEKQKENPKSADSIPSDCMSDAKCEDRWHKVTDSLPDNGRLVLAKDCLGNVLLARYDGENWEVNVYDNEDHYCHNSISKWCEIPSEKQKDLTTENIYKHSRERMSFWNGQQKEQRPISFYGHYNPDDYEVVREGNATSLKQKEQKPWKVGANAYFTPEQKPEWSEEDEEMLEAMVDIVANSLYEPLCPRDKMLDWLKSLRPQPHWKPSEEQLNDLADAINKYIPARQCPTLHKLYQELIEL